MITEDHLSVLSIFSGAGGLDLGFESTGHFKAKACIESNVTYSNTLKANKGTTQLGVRFLDNSEIINSSVRDFINERSGSLEGYADGIIGGPPCQPFSTIGKRLGGEDPRASTLKDFSDLVNIVKPSFFVFENVPNLAWQWNGEVFNSILSDLNTLGIYKINHQVLNSADFGAYTKRKRLIIIGIRNDKLRHGCSSISLTPSHSKSPHSSFSSLVTWRTVGEALQGLSEPNSDRESLPTHHVSVTHSETVRTRFMNLKQGEQDKIRKRWRLDMNQPSNSLMAGGESGYVFHIHPLEPRELTSRECARIQGFPDSFQFSGKPLDVAKQIVNAVPIQFAQGIALSIYSSFNLSR